MNKKTVGATLGQFYPRGQGCEVSAILQPIMTTAMLGLLVGILGYGAIRVQAGTLTSGALIAFLLYLFNIIAPVTTFAMFFHKSKSDGCYGTDQEILDTPLEPIQAAPKAAIDGAVLRAEQIDFSYDPKRPILQNISFEAKPNTVIAFAGPSGGGKSTIFALLERFYEPTSGRLLIGDQPIADIDLQDWRAQIGYVSQDSAVFAGTIRENLQYGLGRTLSEEELWQDWHWLPISSSKSSRKLETQIGERGVKLSGGQKQRIAIARAFLRDPKLLMLDEATASLDSQSEEKSSGRWII